MPKKILDAIDLDLRLFLYLYNHPKSTLNEIATQLNYKYTNFYYILEVRKEQGLILKEKRKMKGIGEVKYQYSLTQKTTAFLKDLAIQIQSSMQLLTPDMILQFLKQAKIDLSTAKYKELVDKIKQLK